MTQMQAAFAVEYATNGGDATKAAVAAGYSAKSAVDIGRRTLALSHVQELILKELVKLRTRSGAVGLSALVEVAQSGSVPASARVSAARALMEHAGMLGTAKEVMTSRREASAERADPIDYLAVLDALANKRDGLAGGGLQ